MGKFHDVLGRFGDEHLIAKLRVEIMIHDLAIVLRDTSDKDLREVLDNWLQ